MAEIGQSGRKHSKCKWGYCAVAVYQHDQRVSIRNGSNQTLLHCWTHPCFMVVSSIFSVTSGSCLRLHDSKMCVRTLYISRRRTSCRPLGEAFISSIKQSGVFCSISTIALMSTLRLGSPISRGRTSPNSSRTVNATRLASESLPQDVWHLIRSDKPGDKSQQHVSQSQN